MPLRAVIAVIHYNGKVLIGKKRSDSPKFLAGLWHMPGETVRPRESDKEALIRGMGEETGLEITVGRYLASHVIPMNKEVRWYECFSNSGNAVAGSDLAEVKWIDKRQVSTYCDPKVRDHWPEEIKNYFR